MRTPPFWLYRRHRSVSPVQPEREVTSCARQTQHAFRGDVPLDLVGPRIDRTGERELVALLPRRIEVEVGADEVEGDLVQLDVELAPPDLVDARLRARLLPADASRDRLEREQLVRLGPHPRVDDELPELWGRTLGEVDVEDAADHGRGQAGT